MPMNLGIQKYVRLLSEVFKTNNNPGKYSDSHQLEFVFPIFQSVT